MDVPMNQGNKRKYWPFIGLIYAILSPILLANLVTFVGAKESPYLSWTLFWIVANLIFFFFVWKCAYKKPGTKLLTTYLVIAPIVGLNILFQLCGTSLENGEMNLLGLRFGLDFYTESFNSYPVSYLRQSPWTFKTLFCTMAYLVLFSLFYLFSMYLKKQNKNIKLLNQIDVDVDVSNSIQSLHKEVDVDSLNKKYHELITQWPKFESIISYNHKLCKTNLERKNTSKRD